MHKTLLTLAYVSLMCIVQDKKSMLSYQCMRQDKKSKQQQHTNFPLEQKHWRRAQTRLDNIFDIPLINMCLIGLHNC